MRDDVRVPCASVCKGKAIQAPLQGKRKSQFKNSCPIVRGAWAKEGQKPLRAALCTVRWERLHRLRWDTRPAAVGIFAVQAFPIGLMRMGRSGTDFLLHAESSRCGAPEKLQQPPLPHHLPVSAQPALLQVLSLLVFVAGSSVRSETRQTAPGPRQDKSDQTQIFKAQLQFLFPVGKELAKVTCFFFFLSVQPATSHELLTHHVTGATLGRLQPELLSPAYPAAPGLRANLALRWGKASGTHVCWGTGSTQAPALGNGQTPMCFKRDRSKLI